MDAPLRVGFAGFWEGFDPRDNVFTRLLARRWRVEVCERPDFLVHSCIGRGKHAHRRHDCVRIYYTGENIPADWSSTDWAFTFERDDRPCHFRLPVWALAGDPAELVKPPAFDPAAILAGKTRFCGFVASNPLCRPRNEFVRRLSRYRPVDCGGAVLNTLGRRVVDKRAFLGECRFAIAFENESHPGYTTEKLTDAMRAGAIPIHWGDPYVGRDFDTTSFLSAHDAPRRRLDWLLDDLVERVVAVDRDPTLARALLGRPWYRGNRVPPCADPEAILDQFARIFSTVVERASRRGGTLRRLGLARVPAEAAGLRRRALRRWRKFVRDA